MYRKPIEIASRPLKEKRKKEKDNLKGKRDEDGLASRV